MEIIFKILLILFLSAIQPIQSPADCVSEARQVTVRGSSLSGLIESGENLRILIGYYKCHPTERDDIVAYNYAGNEAPIIKIVKGLPADKFRLGKSESGWNILINNKALKNFQNQPYVLNERGYKMLFLYEKDYNGVIPENSYLILGNLPNGSLDSSRFGLIDKSDILGKVIF